jgi:fibronectin-binding autotransporter adhesin
MTLGFFQTTNFTSAGSGSSGANTKTISITTAAAVGDYIVVFGAAEGCNASATPTVAITTGPMAASAGFQFMRPTMSSGNTAAFFMAFAKVTTAGTATLTITMNTQSTSNLMGGGAWLVPVADQAGGVPSFVSTTAFASDTDGQVSCTLANPASVVIGAVADWSAGLSTTTAGVPATPNYRVRQNPSGAYGVWAAEWTSQTAGTRAYGITGLSGLKTQGAILAFLQSTPTGAPALSGSGTLAVTGSPRVSVSPALSGNGVLVASGQAPGAAGLSGVGTLVVAGKPNVAIGAALSGAGALSASGSVPAGAKHTLYDNTTPATMTTFSDGGAGAWEANQFYIDTSGPTGWKLIGVRFFVPTGSSIIGKDCKVGLIRRAAGAGGLFKWPSDVSNDFLTNGAATDMLNVQAGWNEATLNGGPYDAEPGDALLAGIMIGDGTWYIYDVGNTIPSSEIDALDGSPLRMTISGGATGDPARSYYAATAADNLHITTARWYGLDVIVQEPGGGAVGVQLSGSGTLAASGIPAIAVGVALSGAGTLSAAGLPQQASGAALSGQGTLSIVGKAGVASGLQLSGDGTLSAAGSAVGTANVSLSGSGSLSIGGTPALAVGVALSGAGSLTVGAKPEQAATAALSGAGTLTVGAKPQQTATAALSGDGQLTVGGTPGATAVVPLSGNGTLTASGGNSPSGTVFLSGEGDLDAGGTPRASGIVHLSGDGALTATPKPGQSAVAQLSGAGQLTVGANPALSAVVALSGVGVLVVGGNPAMVQQVQLGGAGQLVITGTSGEVVCFPFPLDLTVDHDHYVLRIAEDELELYVTEAAVTLSIETYCVED